jgi:hypothetical protein
MMMMEMMRITIITMLIIVITAMLQKTRIGKAMTGRMMSKMMILTL